MSALVTNESKPGYLTTEFWLVVASNFLVNVGAIDVGNSKYRGLLLILSVAGYALSRGLAKQGVPDNQVAHGPDDPSFLADPSDKAGSHDLPGAPLAKPSEPTTITGTAGHVQTKGRPRH
jgi:hypothetical protein